MQIYYLKIKSIKDILINRFIKDKNNFKANIKLYWKSNNIVKITGDSLDFKSLMSFGSGEPKISL